MVRAVPPILTVNELKSFTDGLMPNAAPVIVESAVVPTAAPLSKLTTVEVESVGEATVLPDVDVNTKSVPFWTVTVKSLEPSMVCSCFCKSLARSVTVAVAGAGVKPIVLPSTVIEKFLKSLTDGDVPKVGPASVVMLEEVTPSGVPVDTPGLFPASVIAKLLPPLREVVAEAKPGLILRWACDKELMAIACCPEAAEPAALTPSALVLLFVTARELKLSLSLMAVIASFNAEAMNMTEEMPLTLASFFEILALIALANGVCSAATKFLARAATSTPEPAPKEEIICCALALFAAAS